MAGLAVDLLVAPFTIVSNPLSTRGIDVRGHARDENRRWSWHSFSAIVNVCLVCS